MNHTQRAQNAQNQEALEKSMDRRGADSRVDVLQDTTRPETAGRTQTDSRLKPLRTRVGVSSFQAMDSNETQQEQK